MNRAELLCNGIVVSSAFPEGRGGLTLKTSSLESLLRWPTYVIKPVHKSTHSLPVPTDAASQFLQKLTSSDKTIGQ